MSRIGKKPVIIPDKVKVDIKGGDISVSGPHGRLSLVLPATLAAELGDKQVILKRVSDERNVRALHGLHRALVQNMVVGVTSGFVKILDIVGVGYKADVKGKNIELALGFSHPIVFPIPEGMKVTVDKQVRITLFGTDKKVVGEMAVSLRKLRSQEPYKGKGIRYAGEIVKKKVGKAAVGAGAK